MAQTNGITRKFALGIGLSILLCAAGARAKAPTMTVNEARQGTLLFEAVTPGQHVPAPLLATEADIRVNGPIARVRVRQSFINPSRSWLEARYVFPLPETAAVDRMEMTSGDVRLLAEIREREAARKIFRDAKRTGRRAALVEQHRPNLFTTALANIGPMATVTVEISYLQRIRFDQGSFHLRFPMVAAPRYVPHGALGLVANSAGSGEPLPSGPVRHPDLGPANPVALTVRLDAGVPLAALSSPYHRIAADGWQDGTAVIKLADGPVPADRDFVLEWTPVAGNQPTTALFAERAADETYLLAMVLPPRAAEIHPPPRDVVFVLDHSGSMAGKSIREAREALRFSLERLRPEDQFEIIVFNDTTQSLFGGFRPASRTNVERAGRYVAGVEAEGGTEMRTALLRALDGQAATGRLRQIVFLTDGAVANESQLFDEIARRIGETRLYTIGIGSAPNSYFMRHAAEMGRGSFTYIGSNTEVGQRMRALLSKIARPAMIDLAAKWTGLPDGARIDAYPGRLPDLHDGEPVVLVARLAGAFPTGAVLDLTGRRDNKPWRAAAALDVAHPGTGIGTLWGRERIADLMASLHYGADPVAVRAAVTATALRHRLVSRYTSLIAVEQRIARPADEPLFRRDVARNLPDGWVFDKVFGETLRRAASPLRKASLQQPMVRPAVAAVRLPQTATAGPLHILFGIAALLVTAGMGWRLRWRRL